VTIHPAHLEVRDRKARVTGSRFPESTRRGFSAGEKVRLAARDFERF
jgi:hypothetical protein